jgi:hypothetical protein
VSRIDWEVAQRLAVRIAGLVTKYPGQLPQSELQGLIHAVQARSEIALLEHLYWLLRGIDAAEKAREDQEVAEILKMVREELWK